MENMINSEMEIKQMRKKLEKCGFQHGFTHRKTVAISKQLDQLITKQTKKQIMRS